MDRYYHDIAIALEAILANKLKSILTGLGIIFGVAAVISMLAIGSGAQQEIIEQIKLVGVNNIIIKPIIKQSSSGSDSENDDSKKQSKKFSKGLSLDDVVAIRKIIPNVKNVSSEIIIETLAIQAGIKKTLKLYGIDPEYFELFNLKIANGNFFNEHQNDNAMPVCVIGEDVRKRFFSNQNPIGNTIKCGNVWLKVIGVLENKSFVGSSNESLGISNSNEQIFIPTKTMLLRFKNRSLVTSNMLQKKSSRMGGGRMTFMVTSSSSDQEENQNQIDKIIIQAEETEYLNSITQILERMMIRRHSEVKDFEIIVPELLLKQQQRTKDIFNIVLGAIASISLIVGGIGIMNIMLASVMERIKEIGTRLAIGATKKDIIVQFLSESTLISIVGGVIGILLGIFLSRLITEFAGILTIVSPVSVLIAFGISATVGIIFGYMPAKRAAEKDPVESLRYE